MALACAFVPAPARAQTTVIVPGSGTPDAASADEASSFAAFESIRPDEGVGAVVAVRDFEPADDPVAQLLTEIMRTGLARSSFLVVIDESRQAAAEAAGSDTAMERQEPDYRLTGSVLYKEDGLVVSFMLKETLTSRVLQAESADVLQTTFIQDIEALAAGIGNTAVAAWVGATEKNVKALIALGRYEEAERRLDAFQARNPFGKAGKEIRENLRVAVAERWYREGREALDAAAKLRGEDAWNLGTRARDAVEAAIIVLPAGAAHDAVRCRYADALANDVSRFLERTSLALRDDLARRADALRASGDPRAACGLIDDYFESEGERMADRRLIELRARAATEYARALVGKAERAFKDGDRRGAGLIAAEALSQAPGDRVVAEAYERLRIDLRDADLDEELSIELGHDPFALAGYSSWALALAAGFQTFPEGSLELPLSGALGFVALSGELHVTLAEPFRLALAAEVSRAASGGSVTTQGFYGELEQEAWGLELGAEGRWIADELAFGVGPKAGAVFVRYDGTYDAFPTTETVEGWKLGLSARVEGRVSWSFSRLVSADFALGPSWYLLPTYGIVGGFRVYAGCRFAFR